jgi:hypothetical protein
MEVKQHKLIKGIYELRREDGFIKIGSAIQTSIGKG